MLLAGRSAQELTEETALAIDLAMQEKISYAVKSEAAWMDKHVIMWALQPVETENLRHAQAVVKGMAEGILCKPADGLYDGAYRGDLSLCTLSEKLHLNPSYLSRRFKELTRRTLTEVILRIRMETACELLKTTSYRISEIAQMVGYETAANFSKVFKKAMKMTPREYRDGEGTMQ